MGSWKAAQPPERLQSGETLLLELQGPAGALQLLLASSEGASHSGGWVLGGRYMKGSFKTIKTSEILIFLSTDDITLIPRPPFLVGIGVRSNLGLYEKYFKNEISH